MPYQQKFHLRALQGSRAALDALAVRADLAPHLRTALENYQRAQRTWESRSDAYADAFDQWTAERESLTDAESELAAEVDKADDEDLPWLKRDALEAFGRLRAATAELNRAAESVRMQFG